MTTPHRRIWALLAREPATGWASSLAGVLGVEGGQHHLSWLSYAPAAEQWRARVAAITAPLASAVEEWAELADGVSWALVELEAPGTADLRGDVELAFDELVLLERRVR
ncbi:MAG TPA: hypothetical protein VFJ85_01080 [Acidimicrobiales bacterium]|nr:hypothetical protein [Acidimicrobiales bacterium]